MNFYIKGGFMNLRRRIVSFWEYITKKHDWIPMALILTFMILIGLVMIFRGFIVPVYFGPGR